MVSDERMMHISEAAELTGVTTRAIRHYHRIGLLPEPERTSSGYRVYRLRDISRLIQIRRLTDLGLTLAQVADALDDTVPDMGRLLSDLDAELARQQAQLDRRRQLVRRLQARGGDPTIAPELADAMQHLRTIAPRRGPEEVETALLRVSAALEPDRVDEMAASYAALAADPGQARIAGELDALFAELADADAYDPRVEEVARSMYALLPAYLGGVEPTQPTAAQLRLGQLLLDELSPGQQRALELLMVYEQQTGAVERAS
jgi:DNA-binding transcriptional MerR regulator